MPLNAARLSPEARRGCQVAAVVCWILGTIFVVVALIGYFSGSGSSRLLWLFLLAFPFYLAGSVLGRIGFTTSVTDLLASELVGAADAVRREVRSPWIATTSTTPTLRVQCPACGFFEAEDAKTCTSCRQAF